MNTADEPNLLDLSIALLDSDYPRVTCLFFLTIKTRNIWLPYDQVRTIELKAPPSRTRVGAQLTGHQIVGGSTSAQRNSAALILVFILLLINDKRLTAKLKNTRRNISSLSEL